MNYLKLDSKSTFAIPYTYFFHHSLNHQISKQYTGGVREPAWAYWPGMIDSGSRSMEITATYETLPMQVNIYQMMVVFMMVRI